MNNNKLSNGLILLICALFAAAATLLHYAEKEQAKENRILNIKQK